MKKLNQKGFSAVEVLLLITIVGLLVGVGWYVRSQQSKSSSNLSQNTETETSQQPSSPKTLDCKGIFTIEYEEPLKASVTESETPQCLIANINVDELPAVGPENPDQLALFINAETTKFKTNDEILKDLTKQPSGDGLGALTLREKGSLELNNGKSAIFAKVFGGHPVEHEFYQFIYLKDNYAITTDIRADSQHLEIVKKILKTVQ